MAVKVTFTLDEETIERLKRAAARTRRPKSQVVREAIRDYEARGDRLSEEERQSRLAILREIAALPPTRPQREVERELADLRRRRHGPQRLHPSP
ncbi:MAG: ribbon-helix-helix protein, CopG family [Terriglobales bacterium]